MSIVLQIETEGKPTTNQKSSGRCWIFACLNCMRLPVMKKWNVEEFQFSQNYLFFWDKVRTAVLTANHYCCTEYRDLMQRIYRYHLFFREDRLNHVLINDWMQGLGQDLGCTLNSRRTSFVYVCCDCSC